MHIGLKFNWRENQVDEIIKKNSYNYPTHIDIVELWN